MDTEKSYFTTLDAYQAAFLTLHNHTARLRKSGNKYVFVFEHSPYLESDLQSYYDGEEINALKFTMAIKGLKTRIFEERNNSSE